MDEKKQMKENVLALKTLKTHNRMAVGLVGWFSTVPDNSLKRELNLSAKAEGK